MVHISLFSKFMTMFYSLQRVKYPMWVKDNHYKHSKCTIFFLLTEIFFLLSVLYWSYGDVQMEDQSAQEDTSIDKHFVAGKISVVGVENQVEDQSAQEDSVVGVENQVALIKEQI